MSITKHKLTSLELFVTTLFLFSGGNIIFTSFKWHAFILVGIMLIIMLKNRRKIIDKNIGSWLALFGILSLLQILALSVISLPAYFNFAAKLYAGFLMVSYLGTKFRYSYFKVLVWFSAIGLVFWVVHFVNPIDIGIPYGDSSKSLIVWSYFIGDAGYRNQGMFWEPGAYQGYIMFVPILYIGELKELWKTERKGCWILLISLLSTTSTTGYLALAFVLFMYFAKSVKSVWLKIVIIPVFILGSLYVFSSLDFLGDKLSQQYENAKDLDYNNSGVMQSRMGTMIIDYEMIKNRPIIGNGFDGKMKYGYYEEIMARAGNGLTGFLNTFGIPFFLIYLFSIFKSLPYGYYYNFVSISALLILLFGENFINYIPLWSLLFVVFDKCLKYDTRYQTKNFMAVPNPGSVL